MPVAGVVAARGQMNLWGVIASGTAGAMFGNVFWYLVARVIGLHRFRPFIEKHGRWLTMDWGDVEKSEKLFGRFGGPIVGLGRLLPTIRSIVSIPAGLLHMRLRSFLIWSTVGTAVWSSALAAAGYLLGRQFDQIEKVIGPPSAAMIAVAMSSWRWVCWSACR